MPHFEPQEWRQYANIVGHINHFSGCLHWDIHLTAPNWRQIAQVRYDILTDSHFDNAIPLCPRHWHLGVRSLQKDIRYQYAGNIRFKLHT